jgi:hypothetical protein
LVCALILVPWYWHHYATWGQAFLDQHFRNQMLGRFESETFGTTGWYAYVLELATHYWPWLPFAIYGAWRMRANAAENRMFIAWAAISLVILHLIPRKYDRYLLLVFPVFAIFAAHGLSQCRFWPAWQRMVLPNIGWTTAILFIGLQLFHVRLHTMKYPELAQSVSAIKVSQAQAGNNRPAVHTVGAVGVPVQCAIRFYTNAKVADIGENRTGPLQAGDIVVLPREREPQLAPTLPVHETVARGKVLTVLRVLPGGTYGTDTR